MLNITSLYYLLSLLYHCYSIDHYYLPYSFDAFILCFMYNLLSGPLDLILYNFGVLDSEFDPIVSEGAAFYEMPMRRTSDRDPTT